MDTKRYVISGVTTLEQYHMVLKINGEDCDVDEKDQEDIDVEIASGCSLLWMDESDGLAWFWDGSHDDSEYLSSKIRVIYFEYIAIHLYTNIDGDIGIPLKIDIKEK